MSIASKRCFTAHPISPVQLNEHSVNNFVPIILISSLAQDGPVLTGAFRSRKNAWGSVELCVALSRACQFLILTLTTTDVVLNAFRLPSPPLVEEVILEGRGLQQWRHLFTSHPDSLHCTAALGPALALGSASLSWRSF